MPFCYNTLWLVYRQPQCVVAENTGKNSHNAMWYPLFHPKRVVAVLKQPQHILATVSKSEKVQNAMWLFWNNHNAFKNFQQLDKTSCGLNMSHNAPQKILHWWNEELAFLQAEGMSKFEFWTSTGTGSTPSQNLLAVLLEVNLRVCTSWALRGQYQLAVQPTATLLYIQTSPPESCSPNSSLS